MAEPPPAEAQPAEPPPHLFDLDPELLLVALEGLCAKDQARARWTCKLFYVLLDEVTKTASYLASAVGPLSSVYAELSPRLEAQPTLGVLFSMADMGNDQALANLAKQLPYQLEAVGAHMDAVVATDDSGSLIHTVTGRGSRMNDVALSLGAFPEATVRSFVIDANNSDWRGQLQSEGALAPGWKVFLIVARHQDTDDIVQALQRAHPEAAIIGGMATGRRLYRLKRQRAEALDAGVVGLMFSGNVPLAAFVSRGASPLGSGAFSFDGGDLRDIGVHPHTQGPVQMLTHVTTQGAAGTSGGAERTSALQAAIDAMHSSHSGGLCMGLAPQEGEGYELTALGQDSVMQDEKALVLPPFDESGGGRWGGGVVRFFSFDADSCRADLTSRLEALKTELRRKGQRLLGSVMFTCGGRTQHFFGEPAFDAATFVRTFGGTPLIGMYAGGEIGPQLLAEAPPSKAFQVGRAQMHGFTVVFGMFIVPQREVARTSGLAFADDAAVAAAFAEARARLPPPPPPAEGSGSAGGGGVALPATSVAELRALSIKVLKATMARLGLGAPTPGSEKEDLVQAIAPHLPAE